jgi:hypothetical protein
MNMNKKRPNYRAIAAYVALFAVALFATGRLVKAYAGGTTERVIEHVDNYYEAAKSSEAVQQVEGMIGAAANAPIYYVYDFVNGFFVRGYQIFDGNANATLPRTLAVTGAASFASDTRAASLVRTGAIAAFTVTSTASASNVCDNPVWTVTPVTTTPTLTLPSTTTLFADCLSTNGDRITFSVYNLSAATNTIFAVGAGGTLKWSLASSTINAGVNAEVIISRISSIAYRASVTLHPN